MRSVYEIRRKLFSKRQKSRRAENHSKRALRRRTSPLERQTAKESVCAQQCVEDASRRAFVDCVRHVFYRYAYKNRRYDPSAGNRIFVRVFRVPPHAVWIWIYRCVTASKRHKNIEYAFTDKRIIVRKGAVAVDFKSIDYKDVVAVNLRYGLIDKAAKVGDIYITSTGKATVLEDLENPASVEQLLQQIVSDKKPDVAFTDNAKVTYVKCKYCGKKNVSSASTCSSCGAPLD